MTTRPAAHVAPQPAAPVQPGEARLLSLLETLAMATRVIAEVEDVETLLDRIPRVLVGSGAFDMAWIGADADGDGWLETAAAAGGGGFTAGLEIAAGDDGSESRRPDDGAIRPGRGFVLQDLAAAPVTDPWRGRFERAGFQSGAALPLRSRALPAGLLVACSRAAGVFGPMEVAVLEDLALAVGRAADGLDDRRSRAEADARDRALREAWSALRDAVVVLSAVREDGLIVDERIEFTNRSWRSEILGDPDAPDPTGQRLLEALPSFADRFPIHCEVIETGVPFRNTMVVPLAGGQRWFDTEYVKFGDGIIASSRDVTTTHLAERARAEADQRFRIAMLNAPSAMALVSPDGRFLAVNPAHCEQTGYDEATTLGLRPADLVHPEDAPRLRDLMAEIEAGRRDTGRMLLRHLRADGSTAWADFATAAVRDEQGELIVRVTQLLDMTDRIVAEQTLRASEEKYRKLVDELDAIVYVRDFETGEDTCSSQAEVILGYPLELLTSPGFWRTLVVEEDRERVYANWDDDGGGAQDYEIRYRMRRADGRVVWLDERWQALRDEDGRVRRWFGLTTDITARKQLEDTVARTDRLEAVSRVAAATAHDFGNVLLGIGIFQRYLAESLTPDDPRTEDVEAIGEAVERGQTLTRQLLAVGRETAEIDLGPVEPDEVLDQLEGTLRGVAAPAALALDLEPVGLVRVGRRTLEHAVLNLVINARDALAGDQGTITVQTRRETLPANNGLGVAAGRYVAVDVVDDGPGMPPEVLERVFEPFFTTKAHGTGLGLPSAYGAFRELNGTVRVESSPGSGTTVTLLLPAPARPRPDGTRGRHGRDRGGPGG